MVLIAIGAVARRGGSCFAAPVVKRHALPPSVRCMSSSSAPRPATMPMRRTAGAFAARHSATPSMCGLYGAPVVLGGASRSFSLWPFGRNTPTDNVTTSLPREASLTSELTKEEAILTSASSPSDPLAAADISTDAVESAMSHATGQVQTLAELGQMSGWINVRAAQTVLDWTVEATGLPWWVTIVAVTISVRILVLPLVLKGQKNAIRLAAIQPEMQAYMKDIQFARSNGDQALMSQSAMAVQKLMKDNDCHPMRSFLVPLVQAPLFMTFFFALRGLAEHGLPSMKTGGLLWFTDLTLADPYFVLPVLSSLSMLLVLETGADMGGRSAVQTNQQAILMRWGFRALCIISIPFIWKFPTAVFCYWVTNGTISLLQLWTLQNAAVRRALDLPAPQAKEAKVTKPTMRETKDLSFWDGIKAGVSSQTAATPAIRPVRQGSRTEAPLSLRGGQDSMEDSRERALKKLAQAGTEAAEPHAAGQQKQLPRQQKPRKQVKLIRQPTKTEAKGKKAPR